MNTAAPPLIFLDTCILKHSAERLIRGRKRKKTAQWGDQQVTMDVTQVVAVNPNARLTGLLAQELCFLPLIAYLAKVGHVRLVTHFEVDWEFWGLPRTDDIRGRFYGAPIARGPDPFPYSRIVAGGNARFGQDPQVEFVKHITHPRFPELKVAVGATAQSHKYPNQLLDAFHLLCAEAASANYFLTTDFKLVRQISHHKRHPPKCQAVSPAQLVKGLIVAKHLRLREIARYAISVFKARKHPPSDDPMEDLVTFGQHLERKGYFDDPRS